MNNISNSELKNILQKMSVNVLWNVYQELYDMETKIQYGKMQEMGEGYVLKDDRMYVYSQKTFEQDSLIDLVLELIDKVNKDFKYIEAYEQKNPDDKKLEYLVLDIYPNQEELKEAQKSLKENKIASYAEPNNLGGLSASMMEPTPRTLLLVEKSNYEEAKKILGIE